MNYETKTFSSHWRIYCYTLLLYWLLVAEDMNAWLTVN